LIALSYFLQKTIYKVSFNQLQLIEPVLQALSKEGYTNPTPIQKNQSYYFRKKGICWAVPKQAPVKQLHFTIPILQLMHQQAASLKQSYA